MGDQEFMEETEKVLVQLHTDLTDFYIRHDQPEKCNEEVLTILMQYYIDAGVDKLNAKLRKKYKEDLTTFRLKNKRPQANNGGIIKSTMYRLSRMSLSKEYDMELGPDGKVETAYETPAQNPRGKDKRTARRRNKNKNKKPKNLGLEVLDYTPAAVDIRSSLEGFYTIHDPSKLKLDAVMNRFIKYISEHDLKSFSKKLKEKYGESLSSPNVQRMIHRRINLETKLVEFYQKYDKDKLGSRWPVVEIVTWTMNNGIDNLNKKFELRYGKRVV